jgi:uncharacterized protein
LKIFRLLAAAALLGTASLTWAQGALDPAGDWHGTLQVGPAKLRLAMHLGETSTFDSLDQGALGIPATLKKDGRRITLTIAQIGVFDGVLSEDGKTITGALQQGPATMPLSFERGAFAAAKRPQTPVAPFPYRTEEVGYDNPQRPGVHLAGSLTIPAGTGPFPAVLLITGSGAQDRDETLFEHKPFLVLADYLTRRGVAVLRIDDRGMGKSTGATPNDTTADYATDVEAGIAWLKSRREIDAKRIGLLGHSEGGAIAPLVASRDKSVAFVVLMAGPGVPGADVVVEQVRVLARAAGAPEAAAIQSARTQRGIMDAVLKAPNAEAAAAAVKSFFASLGAPPPNDATLRQLTSAWYRHFIAYDPRPALRAVNVPVLALLGGKDVQVTAAQNKPALSEALQGNRDAQVLEMPNLNHLFQTATTGAPEEYGTIAETMSPAVLQRVGDWILAKAGR